MIKVQREDKYEGCGTRNFKKALLTVAALIITAAGILMFGCDSSEISETPSQTIEVVVTPTATASPTPTPSATPEATPEATAEPSKEELAKKLSDDIGIGDAPIFVARTIVVDYMVNNELKTIPCMMYLVDNGKNAILANLFSFNEETKDYEYVFKVPNDDLIFGLENGTKVDPNLFVPLEPLSDGETIEVKNVCPLDLSAKYLPNGNENLPYSNMVNDMNGFLLTRELAEYWVNAYDYSRLVFDNGVSSDYTSNTPKM